MRKLFLSIGLIILFLASGTATYAWQQKTIEKSHQKRDLLQAQVISLQKQYATAQATSVIDTTSWKRFCDPQISLCFKYPADWTFTGGTVESFGYLSATIVNPSRTAQVSYFEPLIKDGSYDSEHIVTVSGMEIASTKLNLIGSYPVSSGAYQPHFLIANADPNESPKPGKIEFGTANPRFGIGKYQAISFQGYSTKTMASSAQAEAWFKSVDGKTIQAILASYTTK